MVRHPNANFVVMKLDSNYEIRLASERDARQIALMSKNYIEVGLGWSWTEKRILKNVRDKDSNVAVAHNDGRVAGFGIAKYGADEAHIVLLAVNRESRRKGVGTSLMKCIEKTALIAGIGVVYLEARLNNTSARKFYQALGYKEIKTEPGRYKGIETGVHLGKDLWSE
jgi:ribosomal-protein-alanine N-acetyltransferase